MIVQVNMERIQYIPVLKAMAFALCFGLAGCSAGQVLDEAHPIEIEATIPAQTKASVADLEKKAFANDDLITVSKSGTSAVYKYTNGRWLPNMGTGLSTTGNEQFTASWQPDGFGGILSDQKVEANYKKSYALTAKATASANLVQFRFAPAAAKITIVVTYTTDSSDGSASITGDKLLDETNIGQTINFLPVTNSGTKHTFMGLVCPGTDKTYTISVKSTPQSGSEQTKIYKQASKELKAGHNYTYNFSTDSRSLLILNSVTVTEFETGGTTTVGDAT